MKKLALLAAVLSGVLLSGGCVTVQAHRAVIEQRDALLKTVQALESRLAETRDDQMRVDALRRSVADLNRRNSDLESVNRQVEQQKGELRKALADAEAKLDLIAAAPAGDPQTEVRLRETEAELRAMTERCRMLEQLVAELTDAAEPERVK